MIRLPYLLTCPILNEKNFTKTISKILLVKCSPDGTLQLGERPFKSKNSKSHTRHPWALFRTFLCLLALGLEPVLLLKL